MTTVGIDSSVHKTPCRRVVRASKASGFDRRCALSPRLRRAVETVGLLLLTVSVLNLVLVLFEMA
ncbi:MAG: hypothetical protein JWO63_924 [Frankiales bacterium]|jgi:hypothetical protein|nr:hypothetical protein [Frankiales bacterium]